MIFTMGSLGAYETLIWQGGDLAPRVASPTGTIGKGMALWQLKLQGSP